MLSRLSTANPFGVVLFSAALLLGSALFTGCADSIFSAEDTYETERPTDAAKFRQAHLLQRALRAAPGKSASAGDLGLIVALQHGVDKQKIVDRYKIASRFRVANRYKVANRYEYDYVFEGFAWTIEDSLGLGDYQEFLDTLMLDPDILWFEPDFDVDAQPSEGIDGSGGQMIPWSVAAIGGMESAAQSGDGQGSVDVDIYMLDTGVSNNDLAVTESLDMRDGFDDPADYDGHGTHIAGIAAAVDDSDGLVGIAPGARVHNLKVLNDDGKSDISVVIAALEQVFSDKLAAPTTPMVVNLSLGEDTGNSVYNALDESVEAVVDAGVVVVVAAGNQGKNAQSVTPAKVESAITVGSYDVLGRFSPFSNYGPKVDILAPGEAVVSLAPGTGLPVEMTGTSMAAAHVTGAAALYLWQHPTASPQQVLEALQAKAKDLVTGAPANTTTKSVWVGEEDAPGVSETYRDAFSALSFSGNDGTASWLDDWQEVGESNGVSAGMVRVVSRANCESYCMRIKTANGARGLQRAVDLSTAASAVLTYDLMRKSISGAGMKVKISSDGGATWTTLKSYADGSDSFMQAESFDISDHLSANTVILFISETSGGGEILADNVQIETNTLIGGDGLSYDFNVRDAFLTQSFSGNDGNVAWSNDWQEFGESNGAEGGRVLVSPAFNNLCAPDNCLNIRGDWANMGVSREVDLSGAGSARFSFTWMRKNFVGAVAVQISRNGGQSWTTLMTVTDGHDMTPNSESFDITPFLAPNTQIRFITTATGSISWLHLDDVMIEF